jgi:O-antigen/teichoic acid export membrane protein
VAVAHGKNDRAAIQRYVTSGFYVLAAIAGLIILGFVCIYPWVSWARVFNLRSDLARIEVGPSVAVFVVCFALSIPASIVQKVQAGLQEGFVANLWQCLGSVVSLVGVVLTVHFRLGLPWLVLSIMAGPLLVSGLNGILFFGRKERQLAPRPAAFSFVIAAQTAQTGVMFLILQVVGAAAYSSDSLVISRVLGPAVVPQYAVPEKLFAVIAQVVGTALMPLWPAYGEAISRADGPWVRRTFRYSVSMAMGLAGSASAVVALATPLLLHWWVGDSIHPSWALVAGLAVWKTIEAGANSVAMFLNGAQIIRFQILTATAGGIAILTLKIGLVSRFGVAGAVWATIVGYSLCVGLPAAFRIKQLLRALTHSHSGELPLNQG